MKKHKKNEKFLFVRFSLFSFTADRYTRVSCIISARFLKNSWHVNNLFHLSTSFKICLFIYIYKKISRLPD